MRTLRAASAALHTTALSTVKIRSGNLWHAPP